MSRLGQSPRAPYARYNGHLGGLTHVGLVLREPPRARGARHCFVCLKRGRFLRLHLGLSQRVWSLSGRRFVYESPVCHRMSDVIGIGAPLFPASEEIFPNMGPPCGDGVGLVSDLAC